ncbi:MAG TPA: ATPase [Lachnospiraceae bacterium]|nr:ATPase [Lachnospiraceae bacterium]
MERIAMKKLIAWMNDKDRKPLIVTGVRQCGKTYLLKEFASDRFEQFVYINFEDESKYNSVFEYDFDTERIIHEIVMMKGIKDIDPKNTLFIFDEIQECPRAITSLKYFCEADVSYYIVCAGSLLGVELKRKDISFPVGKVDRLQMYPMNFYEFLLASGDEDTVELLRGYESFRTIPDAIHSQLLKRLKQYYAVGGMPYVVKRWIETADFSVVDHELDNILRDYRDDFSKHADTKDIQKLSQIWNSIPKQLAKDNNKFVFSHVKHGVRARDLEDAMQWLVDAGLVYKLEMVSEPQLPLSAMADDTYFKVYMADIGILRKSSGLSYHTILEEPTEYKNYKGAYAENYVMEELKSMGREPYFWKSNNTAEVDFLIEDKSNIIPMEVKAADNTMAKSFSTYCKKYMPKFGMRISAKNVGDNQKGDTHEISLPLYLIWKIDEYL